MKKDFNNNPAFEMLSGYTENENKNAECHSRFCDFVFRQTRLYICANCY